jgi:hypothetical protein
MPEGTTIARRLIAAAKDIAEKIDAEPSFSAR